MLSSAYSDMSSLSMSTLPAYEYNPLVHQRSFRLLNICGFTTAQGCQLHPFLLDECPPYIALSYTWGAPFNTDDCMREYDKKIPLLIQGEGGLTTLEIGRNAWEALQYLAFLGAEWVWVDTVCINQLDKPEKSSQVALMREIFTNCREVSVWLGRHWAMVEDFQWLHNTLVPRWKEFIVNHCPGGKLDNEVWALEDLERKLEVRVPRAKWSVFSNFYKQCRWFRRAWIVQEVALAHTLRVFCGGLELSWEDMGFLAISVAMVGLSQQLVVERTSHGTMMTFGSELSRLYVIRHFCQSDRSHFDRDMTLIGYSEGQRYWALLEHILGIFRLSESFDPRDKIYAALGVVSKLCSGEVGSMVPIDYHLPEQELFTMTAFGLLQNLPWLSTLSMVEDPSRRRTQDLPSWVPDFKAPVNRSFLMIFRGGTTLFSATLANTTPSYARSISGSTLRLLGYFADTITTSVPLLNVDPQQTPREMRTNCSTFLRALLKAIRPGSVHPNGQPLSEALWRTMIVDRVLPEGTEESMKEMFRDWLTHSLAQVHLFLGESRNTLSIRTSLLLLSRDDGGFPTSTEPASMASLIRQYQNGNESFPPIIQRQASNLHKFNVYWSAPGTNRRIFKTSKGYLGHGPTSLREGDHVWLLRDAKVPFVLRPTAQKDTFSVIGETYLHGWMYGEALTSAILNRFVPIYLV